MPMWEVEITVIEHKRTAFIEADTKTEALEKLRRFQWVELGDAESFTVRKSGRIMPSDYRGSR